MKKYRLLLLLFVLLVVGGGIARFAFLWHKTYPDRITAELLAPDNLRVAILKEDHSDWLDRDFLVGIKTIDGPTKWIFTSPDEGMPIGTERFAWSKDGRYLLLVGRHFVVDEPPVESGEFLYLLYDSKTETIWCNASQARFPHFATTDLAGKGFWDVAVPTTKESSIVNVKGS